uniref:FCP1 homology domain-containing protein n=1 Tax=viral metagenome TaxID=1070528 RepID=A0A6C0EPC9_9ZZZZ
MNLILDMDGTLIDHYYCTRKCDIIIIPRPYLSDFLTFVFDNFNRVSIWTNADEDWYKKVYEKVLKHYIPKNKSFHFIKTRTYNSTIIKPLTFIYNIYPEYNSSNTIIIDDNPNTYVNNTDNAIPIPTFLYLIHDDELLKTITVLKLFLLFQPTSNVL